MNNLSIIFDLDGVLIDSNPYHKKSWKTFCEKHNISITDEILEKKVFGRTGNEAIPILFGKQIEDSLIKSYTEEVDAIYRDSFRPYIKPVSGSVDFLKMLKQEQIPTAIATSAPPKNVEFVMENIEIAQYLDIIVDNTFISKGKPNPEIYLKTAELLNRNPETCIVIEDSLSGVEAAVKAGMKVIGITTTHNENELSDTDFVINDFSELNISTLYNILG